MLFRLVFAILLSYTTQVTAFGERILAPNVQGFFYNSGIQAPLFCAGAIPYVKNYPIYGQCWEIAAIAANEQTPTDQDVSAILIQNTSIEYEIVEDSLILGKFICVSHQSNTAGKCWSYDDVVTDSVIKTGVSFVEDLDPKFAPYKASLKDFI